VDPLDMVIGRLRLLGIPSPKKIVALDPFPLVYVGLKLALQAAGFDADYFPFDWRLNLRDLGASLKAKLATLGPGKVHLAAHSMGGLVARAALKQGASNVGSVVMLGTPNFGSYSPVLALRGVHDLASKLSGLDLTQSNVELTEHVFATFPGLAQMLPLGPSPMESIGMTPRYGQRRRASSIRCSMKPQASRRSSHPLRTTGFSSPAWTRRQLCAAIEIRTAGFAINAVLQATARFRFRPPGSRVERCAGLLCEARSRHLPMNGSVKQAVIQLLKGEPVTALSTEMPQVRPAPTEWLTDDQMRSRSITAAHVRSAPGSSRIGEASIRLRSVLDAPLGSPSELTVASQAPAVAETDAATGIRRLAGKAILPRDRTRPRRYCPNRVGGNRPRAIPEYGPRARGAVGDARMDGVLADMVAAAHVQRERRRDLRASHRPSSVAERHCGDRRTRAGGRPLAILRELSWETLELVAENTLRTLLGAGVSEFATLLFGNLSEAGPAVMKRGVTHFMQGFLRGLADSRDQRRFRRVTLCESNPVRFACLRQALLDILPTTLFDSVQVRLDERTLPAPTTARTSHDFRGGRRGFGPRPQLSFHPRRSRVGLLAVRHHFHPGKRSRCHAPRSAACIE
jgi:pimeloyl-ACP methyl ester carboxylesterase